MVLWMSFLMEFTVVSSLKRGKIIRIWSQKMKKTFIHCKTLPKLHSGFHKGGHYPSLLTLIDRHVCWLINSSRCSLIGSVQAHPNCYACSCLPLIQWVTMERSWDFGHSFIVTHGGFCGFRNTASFRVKITSLIFWNIRLWLQSAGLEPTTICADLARKSANWHPLCFLKSLYNDMCNKKRATKNSSHHKQSLSSFA